MQPESLCPSSISNRQQASCRTQLIHPNAKSYKTFLVLMYVLKFTTHQVNSLIRRSIIEPVLSDFRVDDIFFATGIWQLRKNALYSNACFGWCGSSYTCQLATFGSTPPLANSYARLSSTNRDYALHSEKWKFWRLPTELPQVSTLKCQRLWSAWQLTREAFRSCILVRLL